MKKIEKFVLFLSILIFLNFNSLQQAQPAVVQAGVGAVCGYTFATDLKQGSRGTDVKNLQTVLNSDSSTQLAASGVGSSGNETEYFGPLTKAAAIKFQEKYASEVLTPIGLSAGTGYVGTMTRAKLNSLYGMCSTTLKESDKTLPTRLTVPTITTESVNCDVLVIGASTGGTMAAISSAREGVDTCLTEETSVIGGQFTTQGLSAPDEGPGISSEFLALGIIDELRDYVLNYYENQGLVNQNNPGNCAVSSWCFEPNVARDFFNQEVGEYSNLRVFLNSRPIEVIKEGNKVIGAKLENTTDNSITLFSSKIIIDGTELGDVIHLSEADYRLGIDSKEDTGEITAPTQQQVNELYSIPILIPFPYGNTLQRSGVRIQPFAVQFVLSKNVPGGEIVALPSDLAVLSQSALREYMDKEFGYNDFASFHLQENLIMKYRRLLHKTNGQELSVMNYANDYDYAIATEYVGDKQSLGIPYDKRKQIFDEGKELSLRYAYFLQDLFPTLKFRKDVLLGTTDGFAAYPYIREGRRLKAVAPLAR